MGIEAALPLERSDNAFGSAVQSSVVKNDKRLRQSVVLEQRRSNSSMKTTPLSDYSRRSLPALPPSEISVDVT